MIRFYTSFYRSLLRICHISHLIVCNFVKRRDQLIVRRRKVIRSVAMTDNAMRRHECALVEKWNQRNSRKTYVPLHAGRYRRTNDKFAQRQTFRENFSSARASCPIVKKLYWELSFGTLISYGTLSFKTNLAQSFQMYLTLSTFHRPYYNSYISGGTDVKYS